MLNEFMKLNSKEDRILYLDTIGNTLLKVDLVNDQIYREILQLDYYLDEIDFWDIYNGPFIKVAEKIEFIENLNVLNSIKKSLSEEERFKFASLCRGIFYYEEPIILDIYDGENKEIASILISSKDIPFKEYIEWPRMNAETKLIEMMKSKGHVDVRYSTNDFIIKTMN